MNLYSISEIIQQARAGKHFETQDTTEMSYEKMEQFSRLILF